jgi:hypothetical protein
VNRSRREQWRYVLRWRPNGAKTSATEIYLWRSVAEPRITRRVYFDGLMFRIHQMILADRNAKATIARHMAEIDPLWNMPGSWLEWPHGIVVSAGLSLILYQQVHLLDRYVLGTFIGYGKPAKPWHLNDWFWQLRTGEPRS